MSRADVTVRLNRLVAELNDLPDNAPEEVIQSLISRIQLLHDLLDAMQYEDGIRRCS